MEIKISAWTVIKIVAIFFGLWLVYELRDIIATLVVALFLSAVINPTVDWLEHKKIPRAVGAVVVYIVLFTVLGLIISLLVPPLLNQVKELATNFSYLWEKSISSLTTLSAYEDAAGDLPQSVEKGLASLESALSTAIRGVFSTITSVFGGLFSFIAVLVIAFYLVVQRDGLRTMFYTIIPEKHVPFVENLFQQIQEKIGLWTRGQLLLCAVVGTLAYVGLALLGIKYALVLGILAGLTELVPYAGPFLGGIFAVFFALSESPLKAFFVVVLYVLIQQFENNVLVPKVMQRFVGLNPIASIIALLIGFQLAGIVGALFAVPLATTVEIIAKGFFKKNWHPNSAS